MTQQEDTFDAYETAKAILEGMSMFATPEPKDSRQAAALTALAYAAMYTGDMTLSVAVSMDKIARQLERLNELMEMRVNQEDK